MLNGVFRAPEATLTLAADGDVESDAEAKAGQEIATRYGLTNTVGHLQGLTVKVTSDVRPLYEVGRRYAIAVRPGTLAVSGTASRASVNGALLTLLLGAGAGAPQEPFLQPSFTIVALLKDATSDENRLTLNVHGVRFAEWNWTLSLDDFVMESVTFRAARVSVIEHEASR
jgi:hypothetical protein